MEKANFGQIVSFLFGIANDCLVDTYDVGDYRKIILPMMVIRRFDAVLEPTKEKVLKMKEQLDAAGITDQDEALCSVAGEAFCNSSPYTLSDLKSRTNQQQLKSDFILYLNGFSQNVQDIIKRFEFRNQIDKLSEHDILGLLISKFTDSSVNLSNRPICDAKGIEDQIEFKSCAKTFVRTYNFLAAILPYGSVQWEKLSIFLNLLVPKLPKPDGEDYTEGLLEDVDLESYRAEAQQTMRIQLENENGEIDPIPVSTSVGIDVPELDTLTNILKEFHDIFGNIEWTDEDKIKKQINDIIESVRRDEKYNNAMQFSDKQNARDESDRAAHEAVMNSMQSGLELFREVQNNPSFRKWLFDSAFNSTYQANHNQTSL